MRDNFRIQSHGKPKTISLYLNDKHFHMLSAIAKRSGTNNKSWIVRRLLELEYEHPQIS